MRIRVRSTVPVSIGLMLLALAGTARAATTITCGGLASLATYCSNGSHAWAGDAYHDVAADVNYVGTIESSLVWNGGKRIFRCTYTQGLPRVCVAFGAFPPVATTFIHECRSLIPGTAAPNTVLTGVQGGVGTWACSVTF
ncbi:MAG: hypothetical protein NVSMB57_08080 [Actinomycetota bacterium]